MDSTLFCTVPGCERAKYARGFCTMHYARWYTTGSVGPAELRIAPKGTHNNVAPNGYVQMHVPGLARYVHVHTMEQHLGRKLLPGEIVHHIDRNRSNNQLSNLQLFASQKEHMQQHRRDTLRVLGLPLDFRQCAICKAWETPAKLVPHGNKGFAYKHPACWAKYMREYKQRTKKCVNKNF